VLNNASYVLQEKRRERERERERLQKIRKHVKHSPYLRCVSTRQSNQSRFTVPALINHFSLAKYRRNANARRQRHLRTTMRHKRASSNVSRMRFKRVARLSKTPSLNACSFPQNGKPAHKYIVREQLKQPQGRD